MTGKWWGTSDRGVSEVVGVVLLVAIVVLLASTVGYAVLGTERGRPDTPQFAKEQDFDRSIDGNGQELEIIHRSGDDAETVAMSLVIEGAVVRDDSDNLKGQAVVKSDRQIDDQVGEEWKVSERIRLDQTTMTEEGDSIDPDEYIDLREATVRIVWAPENSGTSDTLFRWTGPQA